jgi:hypothetical protein
MMAALQLPMVERSLSPTRPLLDLSSIAFSRDVLLPRVAAGSSFLGSRWMSFGHVFRIVEHLLLMQQQVTFAWHIPRAYQGHGYHDNWLHWVSQYLEPASGGVFDLPRFGSV